MEFVLRADIRAHADDKDVAKACGGRDNPDKNPQDDVGQQVLKRRDAICVGLAAAHVRGIAAVLELLEIAKKTDKTTSKKQSNAKAWGVCLLAAYSGLSTILPLLSICAFKLEDKEEQKDSDLISVRLCCSGGGRLIKKPIWIKTGHFVLIISCWRKLTEI